MIPYGRQDITQADIDAVTEILRSDFLTQGPAVQRFESMLAHYCNVSHALAVNSATSALHIACLALGLGRGDLLWTSPITFVASANCALFCGAEVDFVDIDPVTYNIDPVALEKKLTEAELHGALPKVIVVVHLCGQPCDMCEISALSKRFGFRIIEDASHAIGATYHGKPIGNCEFSDVTVFSFHPVKIITTAEGGAALTNDADLSKRMALFRSHGVTRDEKLMTHPPDGQWYYQQVELGYNYRMTDLQAALGCSQMQRVDDYVARRHSLAKRYDRLLANLPVVTPWQNPNSYSAFHLYVIRLRTSLICRTRREVFNELRELGIGVNVHYIPVHTQPYYRALGFRPEQFPESMAYYEEAISIPLFATMTDVEQDEVVAALTKALKG